MLYDQFTAKAGFAEAHGEEWFKGATHGTSGGSTDRAFFEQGMRLVDDLRGRGRRGS